MSSQTEAERQLAELLVESLNLDGVVAGEIDPEAPLSEALHLFASGYLRLPVVDADRKLVGALSSLTILRRFRF